MSQDCTITNAGVITCLKTNNTAFTSYATAAVGQLPGTTTNDNASSGNIGEFVSSTVAFGSAISLTNNTAANITSISLTAGDWEAEGLTCALYTTGAGTLQSGSVTTSSASVGSGVLGTYQLTVALPAGSGQCFPTGSARVSLSGTTTVYLTIKSLFPNTASAWGMIQAHRAR
jgi:hypothetical protein